MKKIKIPAIVLCLAILLQCLLLPAAATAVPETAAETLAAQPLIPQATEPPAFGTVCIQKGCRTINGMNPLAGSDPRLATAQSVFLFETTTDTVIYAYNPDTRCTPAVLQRLCWQ